MADHQHPHGTPSLSLPWLNGDTPWWARLAVIVTFWLGPSVVVSGVFLGMWTGWLPSPITANHAILARVELKLDGAINSMKGEVAASHMSDEKVINILLATCQNIAGRDTVQIARCNDYWRK